MGTPQKHAALIKAWADGAEIQFRHFHSSEWEDIDKPAWNDSVFYRIKPKFMKYRVALMSDGDTSWARTVNFYPTIIEEQRDFVRWLTDWIEVEV